MPRPRDEPIPSDESLFRGLRESEVSGGDVLIEGIDHQGTSVDRQKYGGSRATVITALRPLAAVITIGDLPEVHVFPEVSWEWFAVDEPTDERPPHAEIRTRRAGSTDRACKSPGSRPRRIELLAKLAARFRVLGEGEE